MNETNPEEASLPQAPEPAAHPALGTEYRLLLEAVAQAHWETDAAGRVQLDSPTWRSLTGQTREQWLQEGWISAVHPDEQPYARQRWQQALDRRSPIQDDFRLRRPAGDWQWTTLRILPVQPSDGSVSGWRGLAFPIGEVSDQQDLPYRLVLQNLPDYAIFTTDAEGIIRNWTVGAERVWGYAGQEIVGQPLSRLYPPQEMAAGQPEEELAEAARTGRSEREGYRLRKDGSLILVNEIATAMRDSQGRLMGFCKISRDIHQLRGHQVALRRSEEWSRIVLESITEHGIITSDPQNIITGWNTGAQNLFGFREDEAIGQPGALIFTREDREAGEPEKEVETARQEGRSADERYHIRKDGTRFYVSGVLSPLYDADNQLIGFVKVARDLSHRQQMEEALREAHRRKDEFLALLAHELRNPMATLHNTLLLLQLTGGRDASLPLDTAVSMMSREVRQLVRLVDDLLDVSRMSRGTVELHPERIDLTMVVREAVEAARPLVEREHHFRVTLPAEPLYLMGDSVRLTQVVRNLLNNAVKFTPRGGFVWLSLEHEAGQALLRVKDNGIGIPPDQLERIFEMFAQVDTSISRSQQGLGLGLTLVRQLVELHSGQVKASSAGPGKGSLFQVVLPLLSQEGPAQEAQSETEPSVGRRIMVVDDNEEAARTLTMLLRLGGHEVHTAYGGKEALAEAQRLQPQVMVLDLAMPDLDGYEACRQIRQHSWGQNMLIIALSGYGQQEDRQRSQEAGFDAHLVKPVDLEQLVHLLVSSGGMAFRAEDVA